ncbi:hypothetical protein Clacol_002294 [Clathrus columnatus]|uniref:Deacetylase sirtuin-type domain-containing protein n=1 Tax=Clathrus columnatus TaxID=1419009 RepID=A0AAV5A0B8_9AGAM|nr:hypothetical protein Clacol_002294 [Clathrus columnatus]
MTFYVPLACAGAGRSNTHASNAAIVNPPSTLPPFVRSSTTPEEHLNSVFDSILKAKRVAVVCGAGISVEAGIPDFRSPDGLFQSLKRDNPKESLTSGKDLFDASVFKSTTKTALFYQMIASLASVSSQCEPTSFHKFLRTLDDRGQLLRVYTQNIDALEMKAGLSFGVPEFEERFLRSSGRVGKTKGKGKANDKSKSREHGSNDTVAVTESIGKGLMKKGKTKYRGRREPETGSYSCTIKRRKKISSVGNGVHPAFDVGSSTQQRPLVPISEESTSTIDPPFRPPLNTIPRCIPLHGTLLTLHCQHCTQTYPLNPPPLSLSVQSPTPPRSIPSSPNPFNTSQPLISRAENQSPNSSPYMLHTLLTQGTPPPCPSCASLEQTRALVGKRLRGVGRLRPSVVLYGEEHREGEGVGEAVRRDLCGIEIETVQGDSKDQAVTAQDVPTVETSSSITETALSITEGTSALPSPSKSKPKARSRSTRKGPDLLLVVGTSLRVPGTKRIVREFSKAVKSTSGPISVTTGPTPQSSASTSPVLGTVHLPTPTPPASETLPEPTTTPTKPSRSTTRSSSSSKQKIKTIYLNNEFPLSSREWEGVFDVWIQGDVQVFARAIAALIQDQTAGSSPEIQNVVVDEDMATIVEDESNLEVPKKKVKQKRKREDEADAIGQETPRKKKKRKPNAVADPDIDVEKVFPLTPPATVHRQKSKHSSKFSSNTITSLGPIPWNPTSKVNDGGEEDEEVLYEDPSDTNIDGPGFRMSQIEDLNINIVDDSDSEELELDGMRIRSEPPLQKPSPSFVFSPAPTPPPTTKKKRKVILKLPPCDSSISSSFITQSSSGSSNPFLVSDIKTPSSQLMNLDIPSRSTTKVKPDTHDGPFSSSSQVEPHAYPTIWEQPILEPPPALPLMATYPGSSNFEYYTIPNATHYSARPHLNLHSSSPLSPLTSLSSSSSRRPSSSSVTPAPEFEATMGSSPTSIHSHRDCNSPSLIENNGSSPVPYMSYDDAYCFTDESQRFGWDRIERMLEGVLPVYA